MHRPVRHPPRAHQPPGDGAVPQLKLDAEVVYLEDLLAAVTLRDKLARRPTAWLLPAGVLERRLGLTRIKTTIC